MRYGQTITWTEFWGNTSEVSVTDCETLEIARKTAMKSAKEMGWTPKKWWQWWRWNDTKVRWSDEKTWANIKGQRT